MPGANLTRVEAGERKAVVSAPIHYWVSLDLTVGAEDFASTTKVTFDAQAGASAVLADIGSVEVLFVGLR